jgi:hypothetical protein
MNEDGFRTGCASISWAHRRGFNPQDGCRRIMPESDADCRPRIGCRMQDFWMVVFTVVFFVLAFAYVQACQKLR